MLSVAVDSYDKLITRIVSAGGMRRSALSSGRVCREVDALMMKSRSKVLRRLVLAPFAIRMMKASHASFQLHARDAVPLLSASVCREARSALLRVPSAPRDAPRATSATAPPSRTPPLPVR